MMIRIFRIYIIFNILIITNCNKEIVARNGGFDEVILSLLRDGKPDDFFLHLDGNIISTTGFKDDDFEFSSVKDFKESNLYSVIFDLEFQDPYMVDLVLYSYRKVFLSPEGKIDIYDFRGGEKFGLSKIFRNIEYDISYECKSDCKITNFFREYNSSQ
ncbi:hypothetical protein P3G55_10745 [Leptospira sp. 96542]|nr:hypothetical protein [Leptospira sp. 96542]